MATLSLAIWASVLAHIVKNLDLWVKKIPGRRKWQPTPVFLPGESHGQRSLVVYSPWGSQRVGHDWVQVAFFCPPRRYELLKHSITETAPYSNNVRSRYTPGSLDTSHITRQHPVAATASHSIFSETAHGPQGLRSLLLQCVKASSCTPTVCSSQAFYGLPKDFSFFFFFWISKSTWRFSFNSSDGKAWVNPRGDWAVP